MSRRERKRRAGRSTEAIVAPGGGTAADVAGLSRNLGLPNDAVQAILNCQGNGIRSRSAAAASASAAPPAAAAMSSVWSDFINDEGMDDPNKKAKMDAGDALKAGGEAAGASLVAEAGEAAAVDYALPVLPRMRLADDAPTTDEDNADDPPTPGILAQTGTLDASLVGRSSKRGTDSVHDLDEPTLLFPTSIFNPKVKIALIAASSSSCHSIAIDVNGMPYGWGRNENGQLGVGSCAGVVPTPTILDLPAGDNAIVGAAVGKSHTVLVDNEGTAYACGGNKCGQLGINSSVDQIDKFRRCHVVGDAAGGEKKKTGQDSVVMVQVSCGENFSVLLSSLGHIYSAGSSEFGQLGNGETGEYFVTASKLAFANSTKFERRALFVQSAADAESLRGGRKLLTDSTDSSGAIKMVPLSDSENIAIGSISCGKNHTIAVEARSKSPSHPRRVFSWGCGDYGCLGHNVQADEYTPRLVGTLRGPLFASNSPVRAAAGAHCSTVLTKHGHVYYWGKHRSVGEAAMRPTLIDALANNGHVVTALGAGGQTVFCSTKNAVTVSWGVGSHGELGYGRGNAKSSSKPKFVEKLDKCLVTEVSCGMGHTLLLVRDEDDEDKKAMKKMARLEKEDVVEFVTEVAGRTFAGAVDDDGEPSTKKKGRGRPKQKKT